MENEYDPVIGNWYRRYDTDDEFQVTALDEDEGVVEVQYFDGNVEEFDLDTWHQLDLEVMEPPIDWSGPMDGEGLEYGGGGETPEETEAGSTFNDNATERAGGQDITR